MLTTTTDSAGSSRRRSKGLVLGCAIWITRSACARRRFDPFVGLVTGVLRTIFCANGPRRCCPILPRRRELGSNTRVGLVSNVIGHVRRLCQRVSASSTSLGRVMSGRIKVVVFTAAVCVGHAPYLVAKQEISGGMWVSVELSKRSSTAFSQSTHNFVLMGPQPALEVNWRIFNPNEITLQIPEPSAALRMRISRDSRDIPIRIEWTSEMVHRRRVGNATLPRRLPVGAIALEDSSSIWVRGSTKRVEEQSSTLANISSRLPDAAPQTGITPSSLLRCGY